jgi:hypothetical protein
VTCANGQHSVLAGATLKDVGYQQVAVLREGMQAWRQAGLPLEQGLRGVMSPPTDVLAMGTDRNWADAMHGFDHGVGHPLLFLCDAKVPNYRNNKWLKDLGPYAEWPKVADAVIKARCTTCAGKRNWARSTRRPTPERCGFLVAARGWLYAFAP